MLNTYGSSSLNNNFKASLELTLACSTSKNKLIHSENIFDMATELCERYTLPWIEMALPSFIEESVVSYRSIDTVLLVCAGHPLQVALCYESLSYFTASQ